MHISYRANPHRSISVLPPAKHFTHTTQYGYRHFSFQRKGFSFEKSTSIHKEPSQNANITRKFCEVISTNKSDQYSNDKDHPPKSETESKEKKSRFGKAAKFALVGGTLPYGLFPLCLLLQKLINELLDILSKVEETNSNTEKNQTDCKKRKTSVNLQDINDYLKDLNSSDVTKRLESFSNILNLLKQSDQSSLSTSWLLNLEKKIFEKIKSISPSEYYLIFQIYSKITEILFSHGKYSQKGCFIEEKCSLLFHIYELKKRFPKEENPFLEFEVLRTRFQALHLPAIDDNFSSWGFMLVKNLFLFVFLIPKEELRELLEVSKNITKMFKTQIETNKIKEKDDIEKILNNLYEDGSEIFFKTALRSSFFWNKEEEIQWYDDVENLKDSILKHPEKGEAIIKHLKDLFFKFDETFKQKSTSISFSPVPEPEILDINFNEVFSSINKVAHKSVGYEFLKSDEKKLFFYESLDLIKTIITNKNIDREKTKRAAADILLKNIEDKKVPPGPLFKSFELVPKIEELYPHFESKCLNSLKAHNNDLYIQVKMDRFKAMMQSS